MMFRRNKQTYGRPAIDRTARTVTNLAVFYSIMIAIGICIK